jgi:hypothetical protein
MRPAIQVTVAASTLLGHDEQPGDLAGHGPIPAAVARRLAADQTGTWRRLLTDPATGQLLDYGHTTYRPPRDLADFVMARDQVCTFPGCRRRAHRCELDHRTPYQHGGPTNPENLAALCKRHHTGKHTPPPGPRTANPTAATPGPAPPATTTDPDPPNYPETAPPSAPTHPSNRRSAGRSALTLPAARPCRRRPRASAMSKHAIRCGGTCATTCRPTRRG